MPKVSFEDFLEQISKRKEKVIEYAKKTIDSKVDKSLPLHDACAHYFTAPGKGLRPAIMIIIAEAYGAKQDHILPAATAIEMVHTMSLVHDDIMDNDEVRRGIPAVHVKWDRNLAILAGDCMLALAYRLLQETLAPDHVKVWLTRKLTDAFILLCEGQQKDIGFTEKDPLELSIEDVLDMQRKKTGELFIAAVQAGVVLGNNDTCPKDFESLTRYAEKAGTAFQIQDDILGLIQDTDKLGKPQGSDIREGKRTLIAIHAFRNANEEQLAKLKQAFGNPNATEEEIKEFMDILEELGSIEYAKKIAVEMAKEAINALEESSIPSPYREYLKVFADYLVNRQF